MSEVTFEKLNNALNMFKENPKDINSYIDLSRKSKRKQTNFQRKKLEKRLSRRRLSSMLKQSRREMIHDCLWGSLLDVQYTMPVIS